MVRSANSVLIAWVGQEPVIPFASLVWAPLFVRKPTAYLHLGAVRIAWLAQALLRVACYHPLVGRTACRPDKVG